MHLANTNLQPVEDFSGYRPFLRCLRKNPLDLYLKKGIDCTFANIFFKINSRRQILAKMYKKFAKINQLGNSSDIFPKDTLAFSFFF